MSHDTEKSDARGIRQIMYREVLNETLREELRRGENVFVIGGGIGRRGGSCKVTVDLLDKFGPPGHNTPIPLNVHLKRASVLQEGDVLDAVEEVLNLQEILRGKRHVT